MIYVPIHCGLTSDRRLADHFGGKLHLGYMQIREKLADLKVNTVPSSSLYIGSCISFPIEVAIKSIKKI